MKPKGNFRFAGKCYICKGTVPRNEGLMQKLDQPNNTTSKSGWRVWHPAGCGPKREKCICIGVRNPDCFHTSHDANPSPTMAVEVTRGTATPYPAQAPKYTAATPRPQVTKTDDDADTLGEMMLLMSRDPKRLANDLLAINVWDTVNLTTALLDALIMTQAFDVVDPNITKSWEAYKEVAGALEEVAYANRPSLQEPESQ